MLATVRRRFAGIFGFITVLSVVLAAAADETLQRPNFLLLYIDNLGYGDLGCYGNKENKTPNIDRLAGEGVRCTDFYIASPSCSPSRGAILTGRHPVRTGLNYQLSNNEVAKKEGLPLRERIIPQYLKPLGYVSGAFGKWNIGSSPGFRPTERGFDEYFGHVSGNIHYYKYLYHGRNDLRQGIETIDGRGEYATDLFADAAIDFMRRHKERPFFCYVPFNAVHFVGAHNVEPGEKVEWQVPAKYLALYDSPPDEPDQQKRFRATLTALDDAIGRILKNVDDLGLREKTVVLCISDNGAFMLPGRGLEVQSNKPLRDGGVTTYEGGVRVPAIVRWPGRIRPGTVCREIVSTLDVLPLMLAGAGGELPRDVRLDGFDPTAVLAGEAKTSHAALHWVWKQGRNDLWNGMRQGPHKIVRKADDQPWELYDLSQDPGETTNLAAARPDLVKELAERFFRWHAAAKAEAVQLSH